MKPHRYLTYLALTWLHGRMFDLVCDEVSIRGEGQCDAVGIGFIGRKPRLAIIEVKTSRSDFLADKKKYHRKRPSKTPTERYYLAPVGIISLEELPVNWGLIEYNEEDNSCSVAKRSQIKHYVDKPMSENTPDSRLLALTGSARGRDFIEAYLTVARYAFYRYKDYVLKATGEFTRSRILKLKGASRGTKKN